MITVLAYAFANRLGSTDYSQLIHVVWSVFDKYTC